LAPGTPNGKSGSVNLSKGTVLQSFAEPQVVRDIEARPEILDPIVRGLTRVIEGPGVRSDIYHSTTGEKLFRSYPSRSLPIAGKTGTAQGAGNLPWNDSSVFGAFSKDPKQPYSVVAYLEKSGYGSRAAAPVVKCVYTALAGKTTVAKAVPADPLDTASFAVASPQLLPNPLCLVGVGSSVRD
jgi:penicillin-binding protein 2